MATQLSTKSSTTSSTFQESSCTTGTSSCCRWVNGCPHACPTFIHMYCTCVCLCTCVAYSTLFVQHRPWLPFLIPVSSCTLSSTSSDWRNGSAVMMVTLPPEGRTLKMLSGFSSAKQKTLCSYSLQCSVS